MTALSALKQDEVLTPTGVVKAYAGATAPAGWLLCTGTAVSQTTYARLFAVIGVTYGDPGGGNFNLPDLRDNFPKGKNADALGDVGGVATHSHTVDSHSHSAGSLHAEAGIDDGATSFGMIDSGQNFASALDGSGLGATNSKTTNAADVNGSTSSSSPGTNSSSNLPPYLTMNYIIKI